MDAYGFDGLDMDWEFPVSKTSAESDLDWNPEQRNQFTRFFQEFRHHVNISEPRQYLLTAAVGARKTTIDASYDVPVLAEYGAPSIGIAKETLDWCCLLFFFLGSWISLT